MSAARVHWSAIGESTFAAGIWLLYCVHRLFGRWLFRLCLYPVVTWYWLSHPLARRASHDYLARLQRGTGALGRAPTAWHSLKHFYAFAETLLDKLLAIGGHYPFERVRYAGDAVIHAHMARAKRGGVGGIIVTAHIGCLELCRAMAGRQGALRLNVLVHTAHAERFNRILKTLAPDAGINLLQVRDMSAATAMMLADKVRAGEFVAIAGDRVPLSGERTVTVPFLGAPASFPIGAYVLASLLDCPLFAIGCVRQGEGHLLRFAQLAQTVDLPRATRDDALTQHASRYVEWLTALLVQSPYDWFNFYDFWQPSDTGKMPVAPAASTTHGSR
jgi:predicted LPLAT superfamily acyltransferase